MRRRSLTALLCAIALGALGGCGASDEEQVGDTVDEWVTAEEQGDFATVCDLYTEDFRAQQGKDCVAALSTRKGPAISDIAVVDVRVRGERATADLDVSVDGESPSRISLLLEKTDDEWLIASGGT